MIFKDKDANFAFVLGAVFLLMSGAVMVWGIDVEYESVGCFSCIFTANNNETEIIETEIIESGEVILNVDQEVKFNE